MGSLARLRIPCRIEELEIGYIDGMMCATPPILEIDPHIDGMMRRPVQTPNPEPNPALTACRATPLLEEGLLEYTAKPHVPNLSETIHGVWISPQRFTPA